ncbi:MAG TPA: hypothetical protein VKR79_07580 [Gaiellaceae bacterium]|nr:hypothetical protein [Gaiellaceae bacterium]
MAVPGQLAQSISGADDAAFFCDNSFFDDREEPETWEALLDATGRLVITPRVWRELKGWLKRRNNHPILKAISGKNPAIATYGEPGVSGQAVFDYYVTLLTLRRQMLAVARVQFELEHGRPPTKQEAANRVQTFFGQRGLMLAAKRSPDRTDEALVYLAVEHALTTGRPSIILTRDSDIEEQLFKLCWLLDTHYRAMLLGDVYARHSVALHPRGFAEDILLDRERSPFYPRGAVLIDRPSDDLRELLPSRFRFVAVSAWTADVYLSVLVFGAEQAMARLLSVKDKTGGLSTDRLGRRNIHIWLAPLPLRARDRNCAAVVRDRRVPIPASEAQIARLDVLQAAGDFERHAVIRPQQVSPLIETPGTAKG